MHTKDLIFAGKNIDEATKALIMVHGRGGNAEDILSLAQYFQVKEYALIAPQAKNNSWYPNSFLAPPKNNEPWLSSALEVLKETVKDIEEKGIAKQHIYFLGFSQGACLTLEFVTRNAARYGGVVALTGGLIGDKIYPDHYSGDFENTPVFIGSSNPDPHVPVERVYASSNILRSKHADVTEKIYNNMGHTINEDEIEMANKTIFI
ncbi:alpha/beta hydrolase [Ferruginibacter sp. HRS2-29]|uniref:alpha/beta hydrolase n=1 Tax=Ferruginibacter sp. HRS2-29 TaxID=2487334 RepID=UPI0020CD079F|nr:dienelactone hydrolase family protein [Ferruginibacter sp. HRS2-29]MCP9749789.1 phospholipase [Ferruginibacter sp. HRS2-29]